MLGDEQIPRLSEAEEKAIDAEYALVLQKAQQGMDSRNRFLKEIAGNAFWVAALLMLPAVISASAFGIDIPYLKRCLICDGLRTIIPWILFSSLFLLCYGMSFIVIAYLVNKRHFKLKLEEEIQQNEVLLKEMKRVGDLLENKYPHWRFFKEYYIRREYNMKQTKR